MTRFVVKSLIGVLLILIIVSLIHARNERQRERLRRESPQYRVMMQDRP